MDDKERDKKISKLIGHLEVVLFFFFWILVALAIKECNGPDEPYDEEYELYLQEKYDGASRYDPF